MDKIMFGFPLSCLSYPIDDKERLEKIISYCIVEHSKKIKTAIDSRIDDLEKYPAYFNKKSIEHKKIVLSAKELGIIISSMQSTMNNHSELQRHSSNQAIKYGKDSYCQVGKNLCFETRDGQFEYKNFSVVCAIQSILGKTKKFKRITKDRIRYAMFGYKSKRIALTELEKNKLLLTDRQLSRIIDFLHSKKFFSKFTYAKRQTYYSTRLDDAALREAVGMSKLYWAEKKVNNEDAEATNRIKTQLSLIRLSHIKTKGA